MLKKDKDGRAFFDDTDQFGNAYNPNDGAPWMGDVIAQKLEKERLKDLALANARRQPAPWGPPIEDRAPWRSPLEPWCDEELSTGDLLLAYEEEITWLRKELDVRSFEIDQLMSRANAMELDDARAVSGRLLAERDKAVNERNKAEDERDKALADLSTALEKLKEFQRLGKTATDDDLTITVRVVDMD